MRNQKNVTELEVKVLKNIAKSDYQSANTLDDTVGRPVWSFSATNSSKQLAGALGSLVKKNLAGCENSCDEDDETCWLTSEGIDFLKSIDFKL